MDKNIIGAPKMRNNYGAIKYPPKVIALDLFCFIFGITSLLLYCYYSSNYRDIDSWFFFSILEAMAKSNGKLLLSR